MKTLADLKRDLQIGDKIVMTFNRLNIESKNKLLNVERYIVSKNTTGIKLNIDKDAKTGSFLDYPKKATLCEYDGETLKIYDAGIRDLTDKEKNILDNLPSKRPENQEAVYNEIMTDGSSFYWKDKAYLSDNDAEYLTGYETIRGLRYDFNTKKIIDESIRGDLSLSYKLIK